MSRALILWTCCVLLGCQTPLLDGLDEGTANDLVVALTEAGITARKTRRGRRHTVLVDPPAFADAWRVTRARGLPHPPPPRAPAPWADADSRVALERQEQRVRLEGLLRAPSAVLSARVAASSDGAAVSLIVQPDVDGPSTGPIADQVRAVLGLPASASVVVTTHPAPTVRIMVPRGPPRWLIWSSVAVVALLLAGGMSMRRRAAHGKYRDVGPRPRGPVPRSVSGAADDGHVDREHGGWPIDGPAKLDAGRIVG